MDLYEALYTTRAMRRVKPDPIPEGVVQLMMDAAIRAPSGGNTSVTKGLSTQFGEKVRNSPLSESTIVGVSVGRARR